MIKAERENLKVELNRKILFYEKNFCPLVGIQSPDARNCFLEQIIDSIRRVQYVRNLSIRGLTADPVKNASFYSAHNEFEEACWLVFLSINFSKNKNTSWDLMNVIYNAFNTDNLFKWSWTEVTTKKEAFLSWLADSYLNGRFSGYHFGNHRKYETLRPDSDNWTGNTISDYIDLVQSFGSHKMMFDSFITKFQDPKECFHQLYIQLGSIRRFGRTAKFDYLCMISNLQLANITANSTYLWEATGPRYGAYELYGKNVSTNPRELDLKLIQLDSILDVGMQVIEDSLCNWQKSPNLYRRFLA